MFLCYKVSPVLNFLSGEKKFTFLFRGEFFYLGEVFIFLGEIIGEGLREKKFFWGNFLGELFRGENDFFREGLIIRLDKNIKIKVHFN